MVHLKPRFLIKSGYYIVPVHTNWFCKIDKKSKKNHIDSLLTLSWMFESIYWFFNLIQFRSFILLDTQVSGQVIDILFVITIVWGRWAAENKLIKVANWYYCHRRWFHCYYPGLFIKQELKKKYLFYIDSMP